MFYNLNDIINQILEGDALTQLKRIPTESIDCIITSPPYWALRDYKTEGTIWDGDSNCEHDFQTKQREINLQAGNPEFKRNWREQASGTVTTGLCSKCNAWKGELGQEPTIELYINHLVSIFNEAKRVLKKEGTCWVVLGDTYAGSVGEKRNPGYKDEKDRYQYYTNSLNRKNYFLNGAPQKSLCLIPERFAIKMIDNGWILRNKIIWHKRNCMPSSAKDRFTIDYEYIYFFSKSQKYYFKTQYEPLSPNSDLEYRKKIRKNKIYNTKEPYKKNSPYVIKPSEKKPYSVQEREGIIAYRKLPDMQSFKGYINEKRKEKKLSIEFIEKEIFKNQAPHHWFSGESYPSIDDWKKLKQFLDIPDNNAFEYSMTKQYYKPAEKMPSGIRFGGNKADGYGNPTYSGNEWIYDPLKGRIKRCVWTINTKPFPESHFAVFPEELVKQCLDAGCPENGIILDMFMGSGTTALVALKNNRRFIGIELNPDYIHKIAQKRIEPYLKQQKLNDYLSL